MAASSPARPPRRTQAERRASTRGLLLQATTDCLVEMGYAGTTTSEIESRAGVSRGARLHHFPTKAALLAAAVAHIYSRASDNYAGAMERMGDNAGDFQTGYRLLWQSYCEPVHAAVLEIYMAARTDPELRAALQKISRGALQSTRNRANKLFPDLATRDARGLLECVQASMLGLSLRHMVYGENIAEEKALDQLERMVVQQYLRPATEPSGPTGTGPTAKAEERVRSGSLKEPGGPS
jgi:AcrR family transcriptional regulator